jgi:prepilin-type N-terminal cleavage/methylation domain-containing protein
MQRGFSLVELSIVLVILGLLVGGVLSGQSLIRASELRSVTTQYQKFYSATMAFRDRYFALPGDMTNAQSFWGQSTACGGAAATGTCNGNGDGIIASAGAANSTSEQFQFWRHMALAGLIEGNYTGLSGPGGPGDSNPVGANVPAARISTGGWTVSTLSNYAGDTANYAVDFQNYLMFGTVMPNSNAYGAILKPEEAWNIDTKLDDGRPGFGKIIARNWNNACATGGASASDLANSVYYLSNSSIQCALLFARAF